MMKKKNIRKTLFYSFLAFSIALILIQDKAHALCPIDPAGTYIEAEDFTRISNISGSDDPDNNFEVVDNAGANGGQELVSGANGSTSFPPSRGIVEYEVSFATTGDYEIWMRGRGINSSQDSMFFTVNSDAWKAWNYDGNYGDFVWTDSMQVGGNNTINIPSAGTHTIKIAMRERNSAIDGFYLVKTSQEVDPTDATVPSSVTTVSPKNGCDGPSWTIDPAVVESSCFRGYNAASASFTVTNTGNADDGTTATITSSETWASVTDTTVPTLVQGASQTVTVDFNTAALTAGTHTATLTITGGANNSPKVINVSVLVKSIPSSAACGEIPLYAENLINPAIMVMLDTSGSMSNSMSIGGGETMSRIAIAEDVLKEVFLDRSIAWGFATWAGGSGNASNSDDAPDYYTNYRVGIHEHDDTHQDTLQAKADDGSASGYTPLVPALRGGLEYFKSNRSDSHYNETYQELSCQPRIVVIVTDGLGNTATDNTKIDTVMDDLIAEGITVVAVGFGLSNASQLDRIVLKMQTAGEADNEDDLYHLHNEDGDGDAEPFMAQNRSEFIAAMSEIVTSVKAQVFHGSSPAPTTSVDNGAILLNATFDASDWTGNIIATKFNIFTGKLEATPAWDVASLLNILAPASINGFIYDAGAAGYVSPYTTDSIAGDNFLCKHMGDIINSTPAIVGSPPYYYKFNEYFNFKYNTKVRNRDEVAYVGANDGALHAFRLSDGVEKWRFYPDSVKAQMALAETSPSDDMCSPSYCHKFLVDGSPEPADIFVNETTGWRTILTTGLGEGGNAFFALDVTYGEAFNAPPEDSIEVKSNFLWEFTDTDDAQLGKATSWPSISRVPNGTGSGWATFFGSGVADTDLLQADKEAWLFAVNSWDKTTVWVDGDDNSVYKIKLAAGTLKDDIPSPPLVIDTQDDDYLSDRIYLGNMYGNMYRIKNFGFDEVPSSTLLYDAEKTDHQSPVTAKAAYGYAGSGDIWVYFGTGKYQEQIDKFTTFQQYFYGLHDVAASETTYKAADLVEMETFIIEAYAVDEDGNPVDLTGDSIVDTDDLQKYRTISCTTCNPGNLPWRLKLATPTGVGSERVISQPLIVGGIAFFTTFVPDGDVCEGNGDTWLFAVDWKTGAFMSNATFDINNSGGFDEGDKSVKDTGGDTKQVIGMYVGTGKPSGELIIYNDILYVGTTNQAPKPIKVNLPAQRTRLRSWEQKFK